MTDLLTATVSPASNCYSWYIIDSLQIHGPPRVRSVWRVLRVRVPLPGHCFKITIHCSVRKWRYASISALIKCKYNAFVFAQRKSTLLKKLWNWIEDIWIKRLTPCQGLLAFWVFRALIVVHSLCRVTHTGLSHTLLECVKE